MVVAPMAGRTEDLQFEITVVEARLNTFGGVDE
jgi:hypothetical protein